MPTNTETRQDIIRPGYLVSIKTSLIGNISYHKVILEREHVVDNGTEIARWETKRVVGDRREHDAGRKAQAEARAKIAAICTSTVFGFLCPEDEAEALETAIREAKQIATEFNRAARFSRVNVYAVVGKIAPDRFDIVEAMTSEVLTIIVQVKTGIRNRSITEIRAAANELRKLGDMFSETTRGTLKGVLTAGRTFARKLAKDPSLAHTDAAQEALTAIDTASGNFQRMAAQGGVALEAVAA